MDISATPKVAFTTEAWAGIVAGRDATNALDSAPIVPPNVATFFHDAGMLVGLFEECYLLEGPEDELSRNQCAPGRLIPLLSRLALQAGRSIQP